MRIQTASQLAAVERLKLSTGSFEVNTLLGGGFETGQICELAGPPGSGKTQLCLTLAVLAQLPVRFGGLVGKAMIIYTKTPSTDRIVQIGESYRLDSSILLQNISLVGLPSSGRWSQLWTQMLDLLSKSNHRVVIFDCSLDMFRGVAEYQGLANLVGRQNAIGLILGQLHDLACVFGLLVIITSPVVANFNNQLRPAIPAGGNVVGYAIDTRLWLSEVDATRCGLATLQLSPTYPRGLSY